MYSKNGHLRILLIEDDPEDEILIKRSLERRGGYQVVIKRVETESEMVIALYSESWDVVLCDYLLPAFSARKALELARETLGDIPFIFVSGYEDEGTALEMLKIGANDFIYKKSLERLGLAVKRELIQAGDRLEGRIEIERNYALTIKAWGIALERRDVYTKDHTTRVTDMTLIAARALGVSSAQFRDIHYGALLHDIGKMGIRDAILFKEGPLDDSELAIMQKHPEIAREMLSPIPFFKRAINIPYCHHEKWDGSGYPQGLAGEEIPFEARLFSIADVFDALTHDRPYRKAWERNRTLEYILEEKGKSFDPALVDKFIEVIK